MHFQQNKYPHKSANVEFLLFWCEIVIWTLFLAAVALVCFRSWEGLLQCNPPHDDARVWFVGRDFILIPIPRCEANVRCTLLQYIYIWPHTRKHPLLSAHDNFWFWFQFHDVRLRGAHHCNTNTSTWPHTRKHHLLSAHDKFSFWCQFHDVRLNQHCNTNTSDHTPENIISSVPMVIFDFDSNSTMWG